MTVVDLEAVLPTDDDVEFYRTHGYWLSGKIIPDEVLDAAEAGMERYYRGEIDLSSGNATRVSGWKPPGTPGLRKTDFASLAVPELAALVRYPTIAACAARLTGAAEIRLWHDQLLYKPGDGGTPNSELPVNVGWHTDRQYWRACSSQEMLTAWTPFHDVPVEAGAVSFVEGSNTWPENVVLDFRDQDLSSVQRLDREITIVPGVLRRGEVSFHHCRTIHGSGPNQLNTARRSLAIHLQPGDNHYAPEIMPDGQPAFHGLNPLVGTDEDGNPDYSDPVMCPRLFPQN